MSVHQRETDRRMTRFGRRTRNLVSVLAVMALLLAACPADDTEEAEDDQADVDAERETRDTLVIAAPTTPPGMDWEFFAGHESYDHVFGLNDGLMQWRRIDDPEEEGGYTIAWRADDWEDAVEPRMAESWDVSDDGLTYTFNLRQGWMSHYGNEFTADDVVWWVERSFELEAIGAFFNTIGRLESPDDVIAIDDHTVEFNLAGPGRDFPLTLSTFWRQIPDSTEAQEHATDDDPWATEWLKVNAGGFGPYKLESLDPGNEVVWVAHEEHPFPPNIDRIVFREIPDSSTRASLLARGEVDVAQFLTPREYRRLEDDDDTRVWNFDGYTILQSPLGPAFEPLDDPLVREALSYAVPYDEIINDIFEGYARPAFGPVSDAAAGEGFPEAYPYTHDVARARELLEEAGHADGFETWYGYSTADPIGELVGVQLRSAFAEVGVDLELRAMPPATYTETVFGGEAPLIYFNLGADSPDPHYALRVFYESDSTNNWGNYESDEFDECIREGADVEDWEERVEYHEECNRILVEDAAWLWIAQTGYQVATRADVTGINWYSGEAVDWSLVEFTE
jgi:peptide/nickel transport system substrate-binding protein